MFSVFRGFIPVYYSDYLGNNFHWEFFKGFFFFFLMGTILKPLWNVLQYCFCFRFWFFWL